MLCLKWISNYQCVAVNKRSMCRCSTNSAPLCGKKGYSADDTWELEPAST